MAAVQLIYQCPHNASKTIECVAAHGWGPQYVREKIDGHPVSMFAKMEDKDVRDIVRGMECIADDNNYTASQPWAGTQFDSCRMCWSPQNPCIVCGKQCCASGCDSVPDENGEMTCDACEESKP